MAKKGRPARKITTENYKLIVQYFSRETFRPETDNTKALVSFAYIKSGMLYLYDDPLLIQTRLATYSKLLAHHKAQGSSADIIERFEERLTMTQRRIPIDDHMLAELQELVLTASDLEWTRCMNWVKQTRKRLRDRGSRSGRKSIDISTDLFYELQSLKGADMTWDELLRSLLETERPTSD
jgi:hypothetical protein